MGRFVDLSRFRALVRVLGGVLGVLVAIDLALRFTVGMSPVPLVQAGFHNADLRERLAGRVSAVIAGRTDADHLAVILGSSSARDGLRTPNLAAADPAHHRWLNLAGNGSSFDELRYVFGPLFASGLDADLVVLAIHPGWLAGRIVGVPELDENLVSSTVPRTSWLLFHRAWINDVIRDALGAARERVLLGLGIAFPAVYPPVANPWSESPVQTGEFNIPIARNQVEVWKRKHWFDASWFDHADEEVATAADVITGSRRAGRHVVIVLMPESSELRTTVPAAAEAAFRRALARVPDPPPVIDLRAAIPDAKFVDHIHLGAAGASQLSELLAARLR